MISITKALGLTQMPATWKCGCGYNVDAKDSICPNCEPPLLCMGEPDDSEGEDFNEPTPDEDDAQSASDHIDQQERGKINELML